MGDKPLVSLIIPTKNSESTIDYCLRSIRVQTYTNIEVIVVDNYSRDKTRELAEKFGARLYLIGPERASQVNFGVKNAKGKYVYRVDSDFVLEPLVVEEAISKCEDKGYDAIAIHNTSDPSVSFWAKVRKLERDCYKDDELNIGARFFKKEVFDAIGGFDETLIAAEDYDLHNRLLKMGYKIGKISAQELHIGEPKSLLEIARKHYYYGTNIGKFIVKNPERVNRQLSPLRAGYLRHRKEFLKAPLLSVGFVIYQSVRYCASATGIIVNKIKQLGTMAQRDDAKGSAG